LIVATLACEITRKHNRHHVSDSRKQPKECRRANGSWGHGRYCTERRSGKTHPEASRSRHRRSLRHPSPADRIHRHHRTHLHHTHRTHRHRSLRHRSPADRSPADRSHRHPCRRSHRHRSLLFAPSERNVLTG
jgi:hypothetical protein